MFLAFLVSRYSRHVLYLWEGPASIRAEALEDRTRAHTERANDHKLPQGI